MTDDEWLGYFANLYRNVTKNKETKDLKSVRQNLTRTLKSILDANIANSNNNEKEISSTQSEIVPNNITITLPIATTSDKVVENIMAEVSNEIRNQLKELIGDSDEDEIHTTNNTIVPNNMIILPMDTVIFQKTDRNSTDHENGTPNNEDNTHINHGSDQDVVHTGKKRKRVCIEENSTFFCSCPRNLEKRGKRTYREETMLEDIQRAYLTIEEIDIYGNILNDVYGPESYVMRSDLFFGFLRDVHDKEFDESNRGQIDMVNILQETRPMTVDFTDETVKRIMNIDSSYPSYKRFQEMKQVSNNVILANITKSYLILYTPTYHNQISLPIHSDNHWILIAISIPLRVLKICDSLKTTGKKNNLPPHCVVDVMRLLDYYYPQLRGKWSEETINTEDRFQEVGLGHVDCGYHVLNFIEAACKNERIQTKGNAFIRYKCHVDSMISVNRENYSNR